MTDARLVQATGIREGGQRDAYKELSFCLGHLSSAEGAGSAQHGQYRLSERGVIL
ncbi:hypothetical protein [Methylobacterium sp. J-077]|uniref:hypothetical protein n=1 Tax=Methylobacterium sp. J-077 TaxID=2836656 RepID=UPI001FBA27BE|nr:hypothetical protein [Methylobacterium sp. J-077]MCJ2122055.1 hypothetical protein [Methylobacterium sp. J-077]